MVDNETQNADEPGEIGYEVRFLHHGEECQSRFDEVDEAEMFAARVDGEVYEDGQPVDFGRFRPSNTGGGC